MCRPKFEYRCLYKLLLSVGIPAKKKKKANISCRVPVTLLLNKVCCVFFSSALSHCSQEASLAGINLNNLLMALITSGSIFHCFCFVVKQGSSA